MPTVTYDNCTPCCGSSGVTSACFPDITIPDPLQVEFFDAAGDATCLEGVIRNLIYFGDGGDDKWNLTGDAVDIYSFTDVPCSGDHYQVGVTCYDGPGSVFCFTACPDRFTFGFQVLNGSTTIVNGGATGGDSLSGSGATFEMVFTDMPLSVGSGTVSARLTSP